LKKDIDIGGYVMQDVMLDLGFDGNITTKKTWELMGKPCLVWSPIQLRLANQYQIYPIGRVEDVEVNIDRFKSTVNFEVI
jgi:hypothetical protein